MYLRFFQLILLAGIFLFSSCWEKNLSDANSSTAPDNENMDIWDESVVHPVKYQPSIWDIAKRHGSFSTFSQLVEIAELEETFKSDQVITVLAPTDKAFSQLSQETIRHLLEEDNQHLLVEILLNHVIPDTYLSVDLLDGEIASALSGNQLIIARDSEIKVGNAIVTTADISASNGVVHIVDQVIVVD
jgi:uncharacterized surface protein with fasciclin (FAS1) repeats